MADVYFARAVAELETNLHEECYQSSVKQYDCIKRCINDNEIQSPDIREALAYGGMGNACMAVDKFSEAEDWYLKAFDVWTRVGSSKNRRIYVSVVLHP
jgi:hypothetical protein